MSYVVIGAGPVGTTIAEQLATSGHEVTVLTRSGSGPDHPLVRRRRLDVLDEAALAAATTDAHALFHCAHGSAYSEKVWRAELPAMEQSVLAAAHRVGAVAVFPESLYSYVRTDAPMTETDPRDRADGKGAVRRDLLAARAAAPAATVSVVASDFVGPHVTSGGHMGERVFHAVGSGKRLRVLGSLDQPHSWTYVPDLARAMVAAADRTDLHGQVLHAPTNPPLTQREVVSAIAAETGHDVPPLGVFPRWATTLVGLVHTETRELAQMDYQFTRPFVMDSRHSEELLGQRPTPVPTVVGETAAWWHERDPVA